MSARPHRGARVAASSALLGMLIIVASCDDWPGLEGNGDGGTSTAGGTRVEDSSGQLGSSCGTSVTCASGLTCLPDFPSGMCTRTCQGDGDCAGGRCVPSAAGTICFKSCASDITCRPQYLCAPSGAATVCSPNPNGNIQDAGLD